MVEKMKKKKISSIPVMTNIRGVSLCSQAMIVTPQYVRDASGSVLFPDRLLHKLHGRGLAKSTICWISLSLSIPPSSSHLLSHLFSLSSVSFFFPPLLQIRIKKKTHTHNSHSQTVYKTGAFFAGLEQRAQLRRVVTFFFFSFFFFFFFFLQRAFVTRDLQGYRSL